ncbi:MAG: sigma 54-interacting transcriptional regulator [Eubacteriales bacterium]|nr:sigma 54-interacting transcriptional regulator [Eubacteriales bacterium]
MTRISQIQSFVQDYVEAIAQVLEVEVEIVDEDYIRIGGTGHYKSMLGESVPRDSLYCHILEKGEPGMIYEHDKNPYCLNCILRNECLELASIGFPIFYRDVPVGVIGIIAFTAEQKERIVASSAKLKSFLSHMSSLLGSKLMLVETNQRLQHQVQEAMAAINGQNNTFGAMIGQSEAFHHLVQEAMQVAPGISTILIRGESGTGKELLARAIHKASNRGGQPFIVVNCPSIPENLLESELFGYEGGAFTGANKEGKPGKFELADHGTIFLDEIGDLPLSLQPKILRVIQERTVDRVGGKAPVSIDVRVITATNRDLESMVQDGLFRADLYYRLNVIPLTIPALRERREDIELYLWHFLTKYAQSLGKEIFEVDPRLLQWFVNYDWPGNVRQLENVAEYLANMAKGSAVGFEEMPRYLIAKENISFTPGLSLEERLAEYEKSLLAGYVPQDASLEVKMRVAEELKISLSTLYRKMEKYKIN